MTLDRTSLVVHGLIGPPSPHAPVGGARVNTSHPLLVVNNAAAPAGVALRYEFELFGDEALTQALPGARGVTETESRTAWPVAAGLAEDTSYWWRARASDGFSTSAWSAVATFTVDAVNLPPTAPVPDTPAPDARVASRQPALTVRNAIDPERQPLAYEFRLAVDEDLSGIVAAQAGIAEGLGFTAWTVTTTLDEDALYYWSARARTSGDAPEDFSPWSVPVAFRVDTCNGAPAAPRPLRPTGGADVSSPTPALVVANASDPEGDALTYRFEIDTQPTLDSPARQASAELAPGLDETAWTPPLPLDENTRYYWRAHASDGNTATPSVLASFFVDSVNEAPGAPVPLDPVDGRVVSTATPTLRLRNAVDPEADLLVYEFEVRAADGTVVAAASGIPAGPDETTWPVEPALPEDQAFTWSARASDGELFGPWSAPARFRVDAVVEPPTAPVPRLPAEGSVVGERRPALVVANATSPDGLTLSYTFELEAVAADGSVTPVERAEGVAEGSQTTAWTPTVDLADGSYQWRARASDPHQNGEWSSTAHFSVLVDPPPAAPTGLRAMAGDATVRLEWNASPEPDVTGYRVYRATASGGPYTRVAAVAAPSHLDTGLTNGVTYYYVVTARDARAESLPSKEAAARPESPQALAAEVRYDPSVIRGECLLARDDDDDDDHDSGHQAGHREHERRLLLAALSGVAARHDRAACRPRPAHDRHRVASALRLGERGPALPGDRRHGSRPHSRAACPLPFRRGGLAPLGRSEHRHDRGPGGRLGAPRLRKDRRAPGRSRAADHAAYPEPTLGRGGRPGADHLRRGRPCQAGGDRLRAPERRRPGGAPGRGARPGAGREVRPRQSRWRAAARSVGRGAGDGNARGAAVRGRGPYPGDRMKKIRRWPCCVAGSAGALGLAAVLAAAGSPRALADERPKTSKAVQVPVQGGGDAVAPVPGAPPVAEPSLAARPAAGAWPGPCGAGRARARKAPRPGSAPSRSATARRRSRSTACPRSCAPARGSATTS